MKLRISEYGKSFYGGWYANIHIGTQIDGVYTSTLRELKKVIKLKYNIEFEQYKEKRIDHI